MSEYDNYEKSEARRDSIWAEVLDGDLLDTNKGKEKFAAIMSIMGLTAGGVGTGGPRDRGGGFFSGLGEAFFSGVGAGVGDVAREGVVDIFNSFYKTPKGGGSDQSGDGVTNPLKYFTPAYVKEVVQSGLSALRSSKGLSVQGALGPVVPYLVAAYAGYKMYDATKKFWDKSENAKAVKAANQKGMYLPLGMVDTIEAPEGLMDEYITQARPRGFDRIYFDWRKGKVKYMYLKGDTPSTLEEEDIADFVQRTNRVFMPISAFAAQTGVSIEDMQQEFGIMNTQGSGEIGREFEPQFVIMGIDPETYRQPDKYWDIYNNYPRSAENVNDMFDVIFSQDSRLNESNREQLQREFEEFLYSFCRWIQARWHI
jgi:hypothetical protein